MMGILKECIDWRKSAYHMLQLFPELESRLNVESEYMQTVKPCLSLDSFPPRILLMFMKKDSPKGGCKINWIGKNYEPTIHYEFMEGLSFPFTLSETGEKEIKKESERLDIIIGGVADEFGLRAFPGIQDSASSFVTRYYGYYTFKPNYEDFKK